MRDPIILHSDLNCFYAAVEMNEDPRLQGRKVAVCGSAEDRHGIVLAKSYPAKAEGVKTGMAVWQAKQACPGLICVPPHYDLYLRYSRMVRRIYADYTDKIEPFGMDESWLSLEGMGSLERDGLRFADEIRRRVRADTGLTVSVGISFSKIFAKLGSDLKKPDASTLITRADFREQIWPLPVSDLLYAGPATTRKLRLVSIYTIGDLARADPDLLRRKLGVNGLMLRRFANGDDGASVAPAGYTAPILSIGHGVTCVRDLHCEWDVWRVLYALAQDVGHRLRREGFCARGVQLTVRDAELGFRQYQTPLRFPSRSALSIAQAGFDLFRLRYPWDLPVRALTIRAVTLAADGLPQQLDLLGEFQRRERWQAAEDAVDDLCRRYGPEAVQAASLLGDKGMAGDKCETVPMPALMYR